MKRIEAHLRKAYDISEFSPHRFKLGAVLAKGNTVLAIGTNQKKTDPLMKDLVPSVAEYSGLHAEMAVCREVPKGKACDVFVARRTVWGAQAMAKPCEACVKYMTEQGIKKVYYTLDGTGYEVLKLN